ncbi:MAG: acyltransferase [Candidatus Levybacteria bacterium]|nr:acyltransferase [Candidatus Levybacteria bacterium]
MFFLVRRFLIKFFREINWLYYKGKFSSKHKVLISPYAGIRGNFNKTQVFFGKKVLLSGKIIIHKAGKIKIGSYVFIGLGTVIDIIDSIEIGDYVMISSNVRITDNNTHSIKAKDRRKDLVNFFDNNIFHNNFYSTGINNISKPIKIGNNVWIGRDSLILKGVIIGDGAIVGARAVVTHNVPPNAIVAGNPAKVVKKILNNEVE